MHMTYSNRLAWPKPQHTQTRCADGLLLSLHTDDHIGARGVVFKEYQFDGVTYARVGYHVM